jgi:hypothetical protein
LRRYSSVTVSNKIIENDDKSIVDQIKPKYDKEENILRDLIDEVFFIYQK